VDPRDVELGPNVRSDAMDTLDPDFVDSIRKYGIFSPAALQWTERGTLRVEKGQRRTLGAIKAGLPVYPVLIRRDTVSDLDLLTEQFHENDMRAKITDTDRTAGWAQMQLFGATVDEIAERIKAPKEKIESALRVSRSEAARSLQEAHNLTIDQAAALVEFEGDPDAVEKLTEVAITNPEQFAHTAQRLRDKRDRAAALSAAQAALTEAGVKEATWSDVNGYGSKAKKVDELRGADGEAMTAEEHEACPGRAAQLDQGYGGKVKVIHVCMDPKAHGHKQLSRSKPTTDTRTPEQREADRAERARVIANNKAWKSAEVVRRKWLAEQFAPRKSAPKGAHAFISDAVLDNGGHHEGISLAGEWLGVKPEGWGGCRDGIRRMIAMSSPGRAQHIGLVVILAAMEKSTDTHTWRNVTGKRYLRALKEWGYTLSEVEQIAAGIEADVKEDSEGIGIPVADFTWAMATGEAEDAEPVDDAEQPDVDQVDDEPDRVHDDALPAEVEEPDDGLGGVILSAQPEATVVPAEGLAGSILHQVAKQTRERELAAAADAPQTEG
jgi:ParB family chromosome partitioning protein